MHPTQFTACLSPISNYHKAARKAPSVDASLSVVCYYDCLNVLLMRFREEILSPRLQFLPISF